MNSNLTKNSHKAKRTEGSGNSERVLLLVILALGILGLSISYIGPASSKNSYQAAAQDSTSTDGKIKSDRMILHLNQRGQERKKPQEKSRF